MTPPRYLNTATVARALGVSVTTVKRWVDEGVLPAHKTAGGHRKILIQDAVRLIHKERLPFADLSLLTDGKSQDVANPEVVSSQLFDALADGAADSVRSLLVEAYRSGMAIETLADAVISPAMKKIGHVWQEGNLDVYEEHRGTQLILAALHDLRSRLEPSLSPNPPLALGGSAEGDHYLLASLLSELLLLENGWEAINLGPNLPLISLRQAMNDCKPQLVWLSVSYIADPPSFVHGFRELARAAERAQVPVIVGGQALTPEIKLALPHAQFGADLSYLRDVARKLHPGMAKPRRGRPAQEK